MCLATPHSHRRLRTSRLSVGVLARHITHMPSVTTLFARVVSPPTTLANYNIPLSSSSAVKGMATILTSSSPQKRKAFNTSSIERSSTPVSTYAYSHAASLASQPQPKWHGQMMRDAPVPSDYERLKRHDSAQRRIKQFIFSNNDIDWRSIPVIEDTPFKHAVLAHRRDLRCKASRQYLQEVLHTFRNPKPHDSTTTKDGMIIIDGEEMVDMIG